MAAEVVMIPEFNSATWADNVILWGILQPWESAYWTCIHITLPALSAKIGQIVNVSVNGGIWTEIGTHKSATIDRTVLVGHFVVSNETSLRSEALLYVSSWLTEHEGIGKSFVVSGIVTPNWCPWATKCSSNNLRFSNGTFSPL